MKKIVALVLAALMLVTAFAACGETKTDEKVIKIGVYEPASGSNGAGGKQETLGIKYANFVCPTVEIGGVTYETMRRLIRESPWTWGEDTRNKICAALDLRPVRSVEFVPPKGWEDT